LQTLSTFCAVLLALIFAGPQCAFADTIDFTVTINSTQLANPPIPLGTTYTGWVSYDGSFAPTDTGYPPTLTSYSFNFPGSPASLSNLAFEFVQHQVGQPLFVEIGYYDPYVPYASYTLINQGFAVFTELNGVYLTNDAEFGTVQYTYVSDPVATPEPSSLLLLGAGSLAGLGLLKRKRRRPVTV
jgi:hypothetical protein